MLILNNYFKLLFHHNNSLNDDTKSTNVPKFYNDDPNLPIFMVVNPSRKRLYSVEDIVRILLRPDLQSSGLVCHKVPTSICQSVCFIVDLDSLENKDDILSDDLGVWKNNGIDTTRVKVKFSQSKVVKSVEKCKTSVGTYSVKRVYRIHGTDNT